MKKDYKSWITIASFIIMMGGLLLTWSNGRTERALLEDQVIRNEKEIIVLTEKLEEADIKTMNYRLGEIETKVGAIYTYIMK